MFIITISVRASDTALYSPPQITVQNEHVYITRNKLREQMTRGDMDQELLWFATIHAVLNGLAIDVDTQNKVLKTIGAQIYELECHLTNTGPVRDMTPDQARTRRIWVAVTYRRRLIDNGLPVGLTFPIIEPAMERLINRMNELV